MDKKVRLVVSVDQSVRDALRLQASLKNVDMGEALNAILVEVLGDTVKMVSAWRRKYGMPDNPEVARMDRSCK